MQTLLIDNYDSFTYNIVHYLELNNAKVDVVLNDEIPFDKVLRYDKVILSPGPGLPNSSGDLMLFIEKFHAHIPMLGICLGFQAIVQWFGGDLINQTEVKHGVAEQCFFQNQTTLFKDVPQNFQVGLYHSWCANSSTFPKELKITAKSKHNVIMAFEHQKLPIYGVQFHPESIITENGLKIINNFLLS